MKTKGKATVLEAYKSVRRAWTRNPITRIKKNEKAEKSRNACRSGKWRSGRRWQGLNH